MRRLPAFLQCKNMYDIVSGRSKTVIPNQTQTQNLRNQCDVFISHRGLDTKRNIAVLLHNNLVNHKIPTFLDCKTMKPGDKLLNTINTAICECKIGVVLFSRGYCESYYCLHELALLVEMKKKKKLIPIYCNVNVDQLRMTADGITPHSEDVQRFHYALEEAKSIVGIDSIPYMGTYYSFLGHISSLKDNITNVMGHFKKLDNLHD